MAEPQSGLIDLPIGSLAAQGRILIIARSFFRTGSPSFCFGILVAFFSLQPETAPAALIGISGAAGTQSILYEIDSTTGDATLIGDTGLANITGIAFQPNTGLLLAHQNNRLTDNGNLYRLDLTTAAATLIGSTGITASDIAFAADGSLFAWMELHDGTQFSSEIDDLVSIDLTTAAVTRIGEAGTFTNRTGLAFDSSGTLFLKSGDLDATDPTPTGDLYTVNPITGAATALQALNGHPSNALAFDENDVAFTVQRRMGGAFLQTIDILTGEVTDIGQINASNPNISAIAFTAAAVPEPSTYGLFALLVAVVLYRQRRSGGAKLVGLFPRNGNQPN